MPLCFTALALLMHNCSWPRRMSSALKKLSLLHLCRLFPVCCSSSSFSSTSSSEMKNTVSGTSMCLLMLVDKETECLTRDQPEKNQPLGVTCWCNRRATGAAAAPPQPPAPSVWPGSRPARPTSVPDCGSPWPSAPSPALRPPCGSSPQLSGCGES